MNFKIVENSFFARLARWVLRSNNVAMVLGNKIYLSGVSRHVFLKNERWVAHELCHVRQFEEHGYARFLWLYLQESVRKGYFHNKYEVEARLAALHYRQYKTEDLATTEQTKAKSPSQPIGSRKGLGEV